MVMPMAIWHRAAQRGASGGRPNPAGTRLGARLGAGAGPLRRRRPGDRDGHHGGISLRAVAEHPREALGEHGRLVLQHAVEQPDDREGELQLAARVERREASMGLTRAGLRRRAADREALAHVRVPSGFTWRN